MNYTARISRVILMCPKYSLLDFQCLFASARPHSSLVSSTHLTNAHSSFYCILPPSSELSTAIIYPFYRKHPLNLTTSITRLFDCSVDHSSCADWRQISSLHGLKLFTGLKAKDPSSWTFSRRCTLSLSIVVAIMISNRSNPTSTSLSCCIPPNTFCLLSPTSVDE